MPDYFQLNDYKIWDTDTGNLGILISNSTKYYEIIRDAIYQYRFGPMWPDRWGRYEYGFHINEIGESEQAQVTELLDLFTRNICIIDALSQTFALDMHSTPNYELGGKIEKTEMGNLVYQSKPYGKSSSEKTRSAARKLADLFAEFIVCK